MMNKIITILMVILLVSCKDNKIEREYHESIPTDTASIGKVYKASIDYENLEHDKFTKNLNVESKLRYIITYYVVDTISISEDKIYNSKIKDSVLAYNSHKINLKNINFSREGIYYISGIIKDRIILDSIWIDGKKNSDVSESVFFRKVIVKKDN